ncbi:hypothetical protein [Crossiella cryophila]|uniref:Uncharacterized protein n=1 Tax=Crossiella cryophila TaxID=43355 RepID=A0A7W7CK78_9PSEU|nr:hypothetical protein [Crossiella cryophila]MBB4681288.1 hypothetical protein [Crossiella cryophila]
MKRVLLVSLALSGVLAAGLVTTAADSPAEPVTVVAGACGHCDS